ncbi:MAG TPA: hypothetical protein VGS20_16115 [Candidatus Acidoferrales bacterium]|nr:hypothetical protein [Candidatus Acidoferrales bacterium]
MTARFARVLGFLAALALSAASAAAGAVSGTVRNGTTAQPAAGVDVILIQLSGGMQAVASTKTDAQGRYRLDSPLLGQQPMLLRAVYRGVNYHQPVPPGQADASIDVDVYEPTTDPAAMQIVHHIIAVEPQGSNLVIGEEFDVENQTKPPRAYYKADGSFEFEIPAGAQLNQVEAWGPSAMPVVQGTVDKGNNTYAVVFPFRPGQNGVRLSFRLDYAAQKASLRLPAMYRVETAMLLAPPAVQVTADGFAAAGNEHGWNVFTRQNVAAGTAMSISVSGNGPPPTDNGDQGQASGAQAGAGDAGASPSVTPVAQALPPRLDSLRWILIAGFASLFLLGAVWLWWKSRSPALAAAAAGSVSSTPAAAPKAVQRKTPSSVSGSAAITELLAGVDRDLRHSVDEIKDLLFRLELRRQAGTLSEEDYHAQRQRAENALRELLRG